MNSISSSQTLNVSSNSSQLGVLDLYCGMGGLSLGFELTGKYHVMVGIDHFAAALDTFYNNHPLATTSAFSRPYDLGNASWEDIRAHIGRTPDLIIGGPPCQGFSVAGARTGVDERNQHIYKFQDLVLALRPPAFLMENVSGLLVTAQKERGETLNELLCAYESAGYQVKWQVLNSADYGVPQRRKRLIVVGIRNGLKEFHFPEPTHGTKGNLFDPGSAYVTVLDALGDLPSPTWEEPQEYEGAPLTPFQFYARSGSSMLFNHVPAVHKPETVQKLREQRTGTRLYPQWNHSWYKLDPNAPSPAVKENHRAPFVHFEEPRVTTPRECARLQSYPDSVVISGTKSAQLIQLGNAVPALLARAVAEEIANALIGHRDLVTV